MINSVRAMMITLLLATVAAPVYADGFAINEQGARATAQAGAFAARAKDPSALYFNPAGITQLPGTQFYFGATLIKQKTNWSDTGISIDSNDKWEFPPSLYLTHELNKKWFLGMAFFVPYGLSKNWPDDFPGKYTSHKVDLKAYYFNPNVAYKLTDKVSVAAGIDIVRSQATLERDIYLQTLSNQLFHSYPLADGYFSAKVKDMAFGWNVGLQAKFSDKTYFGISYRSHVKLELEGDLTLTVPTTGVTQIDGTLATLFPSQQAMTRLTLPDTLFIGLGGDITKKYETEIDFQWTNWKDYKELPFIFSQQTAVIKNTVYPKNWNNGWALRWGNEYHYSSTSDLRCGFYYDATPTPDETLDPILPDSNRVSFQAGYGWHEGHWTFDLAYMYLHFLKRDVKNDPVYQILPATGTYKSKAHLIGVSMGYKF